MTLGGLCLSGCCGCIFLNDAFNLYPWQPTSGTSQSRLGTHWRAQAGDWNIVAPDGTWGLQSLRASAAGSQLGYTGAGIQYPAGYYAYLAFPEFLAALTPIIADGTVFRHYVLCNGSTPGPNYLELKFDSGSSGYLKLVGDTTNTISLTNSDDNDLFGFYVAKNNTGGKYTIFPLLDSYGNFNNYFTVSPPTSGSSFIFELTSIPSGPAVIVAAYGANCMTWACANVPFIASQNVPSISVTIDGLSGSGACSALNGTFVLATAISLLPGYSYSGTVTSGGTSYTVYVSIEGNVAASSGPSGALQTTYTLTVSVGGGVGEAQFFSATATCIKPGWTDYRSSQLGTLNFSNWSVGVGSCSTSGATASAVSLSDGPGW